MDLSKILSSGNGLIMVCISVCGFVSVGGAFPFTIGRVQHGYNVRPDLCATDCATSPRDHLGQFYTDTLVHDRAALRLLLNVIGEVSCCVVNET